MAAKDIILCHILLCGCMRHEGIKTEKGLRRVTLFSDSDRIQTCNRLIRSQVLYSVELRSHSLVASANVRRKMVTCKFIFCFFSLRFLSLREYSSLPQVLLGPDIGGWKRKDRRAVAVCMRRCRTGAYRSRISPVVRYLLPETSRLSLPLTHTRMVMSVVSSSQRASIPKTVGPVLNDDS